MLSPDASDHDHYTALLALVEEAQLVEGAILHALGPEHNRFLRSPVGSFGDLVRLHTWLEHKMADETAGGYGPEEDDTV